MKTGTSMFRALVAMGVLAIVSSAMAQGGGKGGGKGNRGGGMMGRGGNPLMLLNVEAVQKELKITDDQKSSLTKLQSEQPSFQDMRNMSQEEQQAATEKVQKEVAGILNADQNKRLEEIRLQMMGARALTRPEVAEKLGLTDEQKQKIADAFPQRGGGGKGAGGGGGRAAMEEANAKALEVLTAEQKQKFEDMQGAKVNIDFRNMFPGGGGKGGKAAQPDA
jgi:Spy/CpxP family protein refolding chaperone